MIRSIRLNTILRELDEFVLSSVKTIVMIGYGKTQTFITSQADLLFFSFVQILSPQHLGFPVLGVR